MADEAIGKSYVELGLSPASYYAELAKVKAAGLASASSVELAFTKVRGSMIKLAALVGIGFGVGTFVHFLKDAALLTARIETLNISLQTAGKNAGYTSEQISGLVKKVKAQGIATAEAAQSMLMMVQANLDLNRAAELARIAQDAAVIGNINSSEAFSRMILGIRSGQTEILRGIGINVTYERALQEFIATTGRSKSSIQQYERGQIMLNAVVKEGAMIQGIYEKAMETAGKQMNSTKRYMDEVKESIGYAFGPALTTLVFSFNNALKDMRTWLELPGTKERILDIAQSIKRFVSDSLSALSKLYDVTKSVISILNSLKEVIIGVVAAVAMFKVGSIVVNLTSVAKAFYATEAAGVSLGFALKYLAVTSFPLLLHPVGAIAIAVGVLTTAFLLLRDKTEDAVDAHEKFKATFKNLDSLDDAKKKLAELIAKQDELTDAYLRAKEAEEKGTVTSWTRTAKGAWERVDAALNRTGKVGEAVMHRITNAADAAGDEVAKIFAKAPTGSDLLKQQLELNRQNIDAAKVIVKATEDKKKIEEQAAAARRKQLDKDRADGERLANKRSMEAQAHAADLLSLKVVMDEYREEAARKNKEELAQMNLVGASKEEIAKHEYDYRMRLAKEMAEKQRAYDEQALKYKIADSQSAVNVEAAKKESELKIVHDLNKAKADAKLELNQILQAAEINNLKELAAIWQQAGSEYEESVTYQLMALANKYDEELEAAKNNEEKKKALTAKYGKEVTNILDAAHQQNLQGWISYYDAIGVHDDAYWEHVKAQAVATMEVIARARKLSLEQMKKATELVGLGVDEKRLTEELSRMNTLRTYTEDYYAKVHALADITYTKTMAATKNNVKLAEAAKVNIIKVYEELREGVNKEAEVFKQIATDIYNTWEGMFEDLVDGSIDSFKGLGESLVNIFKKAIAQMAALALAQPILVPIIQSVGGTMGVSDTTMDSVLKQMGISGSSDLVGMAGLGMGSLGMSASAMFNPVTSGAYVLGSSMGGIGLGTTLASGAATAMSYAPYAAAVLIANEILGGPINHIWDEINDLWGASKENEFSLSELINDVINDTSFSKLSGFNARMWELPRINATAEWYGPIADAFASGIENIQQQFTGYVFDLVEPLPEEMRDALLTTLSKTDWANVLASLPEMQEGTWGTSAAQGAIEKILKEYSEATSKILSDAFAGALSDYMSTQSAAGFFKDSAAWGLLTGDVQKNIKETFDQIAVQIAGGDIEGGVDSLQKLSNAIGKIDNIMGQITEAITTSDMTEYEKEIYSVNKSFEALGDALKAAGVDLEKYTEFYTAWNIAIADIDERRLAEIAGTMKGVNEAIATFHMTDLEKDIYRLNNDYAEQKTVLEELGAILDDINNLTIVWKQSLTALREEVQDDIGKIDVSLSKVVRQAGMSNFVKDMDNLNVSYDKMQNNLSMLFNNLWTVLGEEFGEIPAWVAEQFNVDKLREFGLIDAARAIDVDSLKSQYSDPIMEVVNAALIPMNNYEQAIVDINKTYDDYIVTLRELESDSEALAKVESARAIALDNVVKNKRGELAIRLMELEGDAAGALAMQRQIELAALDKSLWPMQERIWLLEDEAAEIEKANKAAEIAAAKVEELMRKRMSLEIQALELAGDKVGALAKQRGQELTELDESLWSLQKYVWALTDLRSALDTAEENLRNAFAAEKERLTEAYNNDLEMLNTQLEAARNNVSELTSVVNSLKSARESMTASDFVYQKSVYKAAQAQLEQAVRLARLTGNVNVSGLNMDALTSGENKKFYSSAVDYYRDYWKTYNSLNELEVRARDQLSTAEKTIQSIEEQTDRLKKQHDRAMESMDDQLDALLKIDQSVLSVKDAIAQFLRAQSAFNAAASGITVGTGIAANTGFTSNTATQANNPYTVATDTSALTNVVGISNNFGEKEYFYFTEQQLQAMANFTYDRTSMGKRPGLFGRGGTHPGGFRVVGDVGPELEFTGPSELISQPKTRSLFGTDELIAEQRRTQRTNEKLQKEMHKLVRIQKRWDGDGIPAERTV